MSAEDCILYRKIGDDWWVLGVGQTYEEAFFEDEKFAARSTRVAEEDLAEILARLDRENVTEHGICYAGHYVSDPPESVPEDHRNLCCVPDEYRDRKADR